MTGWAASLGSDMLLATALPLLYVNLGLLFTHAAPGHSTGGQLAMESGRVWACERARSCGAFRLDDARWHDQARQLKAGHRAHRANVVAWTTPPALALLLGALVLRGAERPSRLAVSLAWSALSFLLFCCLDLAHMERLTAAQAPLAKGASPEAAAPPTNAA